MAESPAEMMHNRILNGSAFSTRDVTADAFKTVAERSGTMELPDVKQALAWLQNREKVASNSREKHVL
jgi:hypothetical protein